MNSASGVPAALVSRVSIQAGSLLVWSLTKSILTLRSAGYLEKGIEFWDFHRTVEACNMEMNITLLRTWLT